MNTRYLVTLALLPPLALAACTGTGESGSTAATTTTATTTATTSTTVAASADRENLLRRLVEEEKVAHDLYLAFDEKYDTRVFSNIQRGEVGHQDAVMRLIDAAGVEDPRSTTPGEFADPELQQVYDDFLAQGQESVTAAYQVGVDFEEWDIAGLEEELAATPSEDTEMRDLLQFLLDGSRRHLEAFQRQVDNPGGMTPGQGGPPSTR